MDFNKQGPKCWKKKKINHEVNMGKLTENKYSDSFLYLNLFGVTHLVIFGLFEEFTYHIVQILQDIPAMIFGASATF